MVPTLDFASLRVHDLPRAAAFYTDVLGFAVEDRSRPGAVVFKNGGGATFALVTARTDLETRLGAGVALWFTTENADALAARVTEAGGEVVQPPQDGPFGRMCVVADLDGYRLTFHQAA